jgi:hypothetical protein
LNDAQNPGAEIGQVHDAMQPKVDAWKFDPTQAIQRASRQTPRDVYVGEGPNLALAMT